MGHDALFGARTTNTCRGVVPPEAPHHRRPQQSPAQCRQRPRLPPIIDPIHPPVRPLLHRSRLHRRSRRLRARRSHRPTRIPHLLNHRLLPASPIRHGLLAGPASVGRERPHHHPPRRHTLRQPGVDHAPRAAHRHSPTAHPSAPSWHSSSRPCARTDHRRTPPVARPSSIICIIGIPAGNAPTCNGVSTATGPPRGIIQRDRLARRLRRPGGTHRKRHGNGARAKNQCTKSSHPRRPPTLVG